MRVRIYVCLLLAISFANEVMAQFPARTTQEIQLLINEKNSRTPVQKKIDSRLLQFVREKRGQQMVAGVNLERVKVESDSKGNFEVDIQGRVDDNLITRLEAMGAKIISSSMQFNAIRASVDAAMVERIAAFSEISFIEPADKMQLEGRTNDNGRPKTTLLKTRNPVTRASFEERTKRVQKIIQQYVNEREKASPFFSGLLNSQGDKAHRADETRNTYGYAGQGIRIGLISDSYNSLGGAATDVVNGELPGIGNPVGNTTPVTVVQDAAGTDEGRAMMQIVHDLAPKAQLFFATANGGQANFAANILALRNAPNNCDVIIDDISYSAEPVFYDGVIAQAVNTVTAGGALYFGSAGNAGSVAKNTAGAYEADFTDVGSTVFAGSTKLGSVHNFGTVAVPVIGDSIILAGTFYGLHWADAPSASSNDYDLFLVSAAGVVKASSTNIQNGTQNPYEEITPPAFVAGDRLVIFKSATAAPRALHLNTQRGKIRYATVGQTHGHASAAAAFAVAATPAASPSSAVTTPGPFPAAFSSANQVEAFSSDGPRRVFFNSNGSPITSGNFLFQTNGGSVRNKPDITAADGVSTTVATLANFYGTSAAAPHAGAIAGLLKSANPALSAAQIRAILTTTTADIESPGFDNVSGYGILQAFQAMQLLSPVAQATLSLGTTTASEGSFKNGNGSLDPGEIGNLNVQLSNFSTVSATSVLATLSTSTPGVTVIQPTTNYPTIGGGSSALNVTPFIIALNSNLVCGSNINFTITIAFQGGLSPSIYQFTMPVGSLPYAGGIASVLGAVPIAGAGYTVASGQQTGRLVRTGVASLCGVVTANPGLTVTTGARQFDAYTFTNTNSTSQCVTVTLTGANGINLFVSAYDDAGFVPANPATNFLAGPGSSSATQTFNFTAAPGKAFTIVIHDINVTPASNSPYRLTVSLANCSAGPACTPTVITSTIVPAGQTGTPYSQTFAATGGSGNYNFMLIGNLPGGLSFSGNKLSGTPSQAGSFDIRIAAADLTGCPPDTNNYTLTIAGFPPASSIPIAGTPQTALPQVDFKDSLKVLVLDALNRPLSGVNVIFTAPKTGAGGTFTGDVKSVTVLTAANGVAAAPTFTANTTLGSFTVTASVTGLKDLAFNLTNFCPVAFIVTTNADNGPGSLREVINNTCPGSTVIFDPSVTNIVLTSGELVITKAISIFGPGASKLTLSGNNNSRIFNITAGLAAVSISGMTLRDGKPNGGSTGGGAILINNGTNAGAVNITGCVITNNDVSLSGNALGGGIDNEGGKVTITYSSITNNTATFRGGGIQNQGYGSMNIYNSTISGNTAGTAGIGGGIRSFLPLVISNSTIVGNSAQTGGNFSRSGDSITLSNTIVAGGTLIGTGGTGPDLSGGAFKSGDYNLVQNLAGSGTIVGNVAHNITGVDPLMLPLANYGGETTTRLPQPSSIVINAGDPALAADVDQRGLTRGIGLPDIGAVETNYLLTAIAGNAQKTPLLTPFLVPLQARVTEYSNLIPGARVFFSAPVTGPSGTFPNVLTRDTITTGVSGIATGRVFRANSIAGIYRDTARISSAMPAVTFELTNIGGDESPLPVIFGSVTASVTNCVTKIEWKTLTEINTKDFTVEYSTDGQSFTALSILPAKGNSTTPQSYSYADVSALAGVSYYRIRQSDLNGAFTYSSVMNVTNSCGRQAIVAYPNPVRSKLTVIIPGTEKRLLTVFDAAGHKVFQQNVSGGKYDINASGWVQGVYTLSVSQKGEKDFMYKIVKD